MVCVALKKLTKSKEKERVIRKAFSLCWGFDANEWDEMEEDLKTGPRKTEISNCLCTSGGGEQVIATTDRGFGTDSV